MDIVNGLFEIIGGFILFLNIMSLYRDKQIKGVSIAPVIFYSAWGYWNLFYYPSLNQWWSFIGGILVVIMNSIWVGMAIYYKRKS